MKLEFRRWHDILIAIAALSITIHVHSEPVKLDIRNPHYLAFRGRPLILIGSSEHYGSVINRDFDYIQYLDTLQAAGLNATRLFSGQYRERPGPFGPTLDMEIIENTLAPNANSYVAPWQRTDTPGAGDGGKKFDLTQWNDEYFLRLRDFVSKALERSIVVEISLFSPYYSADVGDWFWKISPLNIRNNTNGVGDVTAGDALSLKDTRLVAAEDALVQKIVEELRDFDNIYYEICNEPNWGDVAPDWQAHMAATVADAESNYRFKHLIAQEVVDPREYAEKIKQNHSDWELYSIQHRVPQADLFAFHNANAHDIGANLDVQKPIGQNEFVGMVSTGAIRANAWRLFMAGAGFDIETDYSFTRGHERGDFVVPAGGAGGGSPELRLELGILLSFMNQMDFTAMRPSNAFIKSVTLDKGSVLALEEPGRNYVIYLDHIPMSANNVLSTQDNVNARHKTMLTIDLPSGHYVATWIDPKTGFVSKIDSYFQGGQQRKIASPIYIEDIVLRIVRK